MKEIDTILTEIVQDLKEPYFQCPEVRYQTIGPAADVVDEEEYHMWKMGLIILWLGGLAVIDIRQRRVPVWFLTVGGLFAIIAAAYSYSGGTKYGVEMLWGMMPGGFLLFAAAVSKKAGWADGVVLMILGLLVDYRICAVSFAISLFAISIVSLLLLAFRRIGRNTRLPYLPFLWVGCLFQAVFGLGVR